MKVSVVTVSFNNADTVTDTVRSVIDQLPPNWSTSWSTMGKEARKKVQDHFRVERTAQQQRQVHESIGASSP